MVKLWMLVLSVGCLILSLGIYNFVSDLLSMPPIRLSLPYLIIGALIIVVLAVRKPWLKK
jgi:hypothetical protein